MQIQYGVEVDASRIKVDKKKALIFLSSIDTGDLIIARTVAADYAAICSLANMRRIVAQSLDATQTEAKTNGSLMAPSTTLTTPKPED